MRSKPQPEPRALSADDLSMTLQHAKAVRDAGQAEAKLIYRKAMQEAQNRYEADREYILSTAQERAQAAGVIAADFIAEQEAYEVVAQQAAE